MLNEAWSLNGRSFEMDAVADDEIVQANTLEVWEFINVVNEGETGAMEDGNGGHDMGNMNMGNGEVKTEDQMAHPMHIHGVQFQILERTISEAFQEGWETVSAGYVDEGWKDTVLLMPGERVKLLMRFGSDLGLFVFHCHNLEHEDLGLMRNYQVQ
jgi:FtsP/CotA-like multicopper oxidase with cupredoxin domain